MYGFFQTIQETDDLHYLDVFAYIIGLDNYFKILTDWERDYEIDDWRGSASNFTYPKSVSVWKINLIQPLIN